MAVPPGGFFFCFPSRNCWQCHLWFTGTAVLPQVTKLWQSGLALGSWLTIAVQIGFSLGAIFFALFNIPDIFNPIRVLFVSALLAAASNAAFAFVAQDPVPAILFRGATGFFLAGVYPVGMKIIAGMVSARTRSGSRHHDRRAYCGLGSTSRRQLFRRHLLAQCSASGKCTGGRRSVHRPVRRA